MEIYENYPITTVLIRNLLNLAMLLVAVVVLLGLTKWVAVIYIIYSIVTFVIFLVKVCTKCYYHGKICSTGVGKIAGVLFKKGAENLHADAFKNIFVLFLLVWILPIIGGITALMRQFTATEFFRLLVFVILIGLSIVGNKRLGCRQCKMQDTCPAMKS